MKRTLNRFSLITSILASGLLTSCGGGGSTQAAGNGTLQVSLTDAPACGYDAVYVTVSKVRVHQSASADGSDSGWTDITLNPARKINLLDLTNGVLDELGQVSLPAGRYTQVRLVLQANTGNTVANSVVLSGTTTEVALDTPSAVQSGIKLINAFDVTSGEQTDLVLDFDACKSIVTKGNGGYALKPVIKIVPASLNGIEGYIDTTALNSNVMVTAQQNGAIIGGTVPDPQTGRFLLSRLAPGDYDVVITGDGRKTTVVGKVPVATPTTTVAVSTSGAPITLQTAASPARTISGTVTLNPASTTGEVSYVAAKQSFSAGPTITVKYRGADVASGTYSLDNLPSVAPMFAQYSATLPITFAEQTSTSPGTGKYNIEVSATGYQTQFATVDVSAGNANMDVTLTQ